MVSKQMWTFETAAHETELRDTQGTYISDALAHFEEGRRPTHKAIACAPAKCQAFEQCSVFSMKPFFVVHGGQQLRRC